MRKVDGPSSRTPAVKLGILDAFRPNGPDGMWLFTGDPSAAPSKTADTTRSTIAAANFRSSRTAGSPSARSIGYRLWLLRLQPFEDGLQGLDLRRSWLRVEIDEPAQRRDQDRTFVIAKV